MACFHLWDEERCAPGACRPRDTHTLNSLPPTKTVRGIASLEGKLRAVLRAHIEMRAALSASEIQQYNVLRGYGLRAEQQHPRH
jgi:hypothetical protein